MRLERTARIRRTTSLTSLVDVVFLLLLFFMLASSFSRFSVIEVGLGGSGGAGSVPSAALTNVLLTVDADGRTAVNGAPVEIAALAERLRATGDGSEQRILVRATARATTQDIVSVIEVARGADAGDVILVR